MVDLDELAAFLVRSTRLDADEARRVLGDVVAWLATETVEQFVVRRHRELKESYSQRNDAIYRRIAEEIAQRPFAAAPLTERQIRRLIYG
jgi:hypothetical protein